MGAIPKVLKDFKVYIDGIGYGGEISEIELPKITQAIEDYRVGYMTVPVSLGLEPMEATITMVEQTYAVFSTFGILNNTTGNLISFRGYQDGDGGMLAADSIEIQMRGIFKELDLGTAKKGEMPSYKLALAVDTFIYKIGNNLVMTIEPRTNTFMVGGVDQLLGVKKALGMI